MNRADVIKQEAIYYVDELNLPIIPICAAEHKGMSLEHTNKCKSSGKAPILSKWTSKEITTVNEINIWFDDCKTINIGLPLGQISGVVGVDIDGSHGEKMLNSVAGNDMPYTWEFTTHSGRRILYRLPDDVKTKKKAIVGEGDHEEFAILCDGQQTVMPPSVHTKGTVYKWTESRSPREQKIAMAPDWVMKLITANGNGNGYTFSDFEEKPEPTVDKKDFKGNITKGERNNHITKLAGSLLSRDNFPEEEALSYLQHWNERHCDPPLPKEEIINIIKSISVNEKLKKSKKKEKESDSESKKKFRPTIFARAFVDIQKELGYIWKFSMEMSAFYRCDVTSGPWKMLNETFVKSEIRKALTNIKRGGAVKWDSKYYVSEGFDALKSYLIEPDIEGNIFDVGQHIFSDDLGYDPLSYIFVKNGVYNWEDKTLVPWSPKFYTTTQLPVDYKHQVNCPHWIEALHDWIPQQETINFLQEYVGLCLIPDTSFRTAVFLYGSGANGKSMFIDAIKMLFGKSLISIPLHKLATRFEVAYIQNKLVNICGDIDSKYISDTGILKSLISGDTLRGEFKHGASFDFVPVCRLLFSANTLPRVGDKTPSWYSRWKFVEFPHTFELNPNYKLKYERYFKREKDGIFLWALEGLHRLMENNEWTISKDMKKSEDDYRMANDNVSAFLKETITQTGSEEVYVPSNALHNLYTEWTQEYVGKNVSVGKIEFTKRLKSEGFTTKQVMINGKRKTIYLNMEIKKEYEKVLHMYDDIH